MKYLIYTINVFIVAIIVWRYIATNSDKSIIIIMVFYPFVLLLNLIIAGVLRLLKIEAYKYFVSSCLLLLALFIPVFILCSSLN